VKLGFAHDVLQRLALRRDAAPAGGLFSSSASGQRPLELQVKLHALQAKRRGRPATRR
jgi:hypothetical protein